jgi:hypothetical protein
MWPFSSHTRLPTVDAGSEEATPPVVGAHDTAALAALHADAAHWSDVRICGIDEGLYFAKRDPRLCVRKRSRMLSWTLNFGNPRALTVLLVLILGVGLAPTIINVLTISRLIRRC